jgi:hypothetical protein
MQSSQQQILFEEFWNWSKDGTKDSDDCLSHLNPKHDFNLLRQTQDMIDELVIVLHYIRTAQGVGDRFVKQVEHILDPEAKWRDGFSAHDWTSGRRSLPPVLIPRHSDPESMEDDKNREQLIWFRSNAFNVMCRLGDRISEVEDLKSTTEATLQRVHPYLFPSMLLDTSQARICSG